MDILAIEPFYGGSHRAFLDGWQAHSSHTWQTHGLPDRHWKWRMRHAPVTLAAELRSVQADVLWCSDMLNLAELRGLAPHLAEIPNVIYFHENQLTYPVRIERKRDMHFAFTNIVSALAADAVWFNSAYHRDVFLEAAGEFLRRMPDYPLPGAVEQIRERAEVWPQGIYPIANSANANEPLHILWAARWEFDKGPEVFFAALDFLARRRIDFSVSVIGEQSRRQPAIFAKAKSRHESRIRHWGFQATRGDYEAVLASADVVVSTAIHEFFGVAVAEAVSAGALPLAPWALAYPETLAGLESEACFHDGTVEDLANRLEACVCRHQAGELWRGDRKAGQELMQRFHWPRLAPKLDSALTAVARPSLVSQSSQRLSLGQSTGSSL
ncbi:MAG: glycosyltransferase involved in cell wall biosynthesis [Rhodothermales bacterium]|jgi:glycosyltransferase involved in cell wall biosynthesis